MVIRISLLLCVLLASGCGGGGATLQALADATPTTSGSCSDGAMSLRIGLDANANGVLEDGEVSFTQVVCTVAGDSGWLVALVDEPAGANCAAGGKRALFGRDNDGDGVLQASEAGSSAFVCDGASGPQGPAGADGYDNMLVTTAEPAGANCAHGGTRVQNGRDTDRNAVLDPTEVAQTAYVCDPPPAGLAWLTIAADTVAQANAGYLVDSLSEVAVTLPDAPPVNSVVRVNGLGAGGWRVEQQAGQFVQTTALAGSARGIGPWTFRDSPQQLEAVASSSDGRHMALVSVEGVYTSTDFGSTWTRRLDLAAGPSGNVGIAGIASSADGRRVVVASGGENIRVSEDYGLTWFERPGSPAARAVAASATGNTLLAAADQLYVSRDFGVSWSPAGLQGFHLAMSADGQYMLAINSIQIFVSSDFGATWTRVVEGLSRSFFRATVSADGSRMAVGDLRGQLRVSEDHGSTWSLVPITAIGALAGSADGRVLVAGGISGNLHVSEDYGLTWSVRASTGVALFDAACSADCGRAVVFSRSGDSSSLFTAPTTTFAGPGRGLAGPQGSSVELQYGGGGGWTVLDYAGEVSTR